MLLDSRHSAGVSHSTVPVQVAIDGSTQSRGSVLPYVAPRYSQLWAWRLATCGRETVRVWGGAGTTVHVGSEVQASTPCKLDRQ